MATPEARFQPTVAVKGAAPAPRDEKTPLTCDRDVELLRSGGRPYKKFVAGHPGLHIEVFPATPTKPGGSKLWRVRVEVSGKERRVAIGRFPDVSFAMAVEARRQALADAAEGADPTVAKHIRLSAARREQRAEVARAKADKTLGDLRKLEPICRAWMKSRDNVRWTPKQTRTVELRLERWVFPHLGGRFVESVEPGELLAVLKDITDASGEALGETQHRVAAYVRSALQWGLGQFHFKKFPEVGAGSLDPKPYAKSHPAPKHATDVGRLLDKIHRFEAEPAIMGALKCLPYLFCRPGELRAMRFEDLSDLDGPDPRWTFAMGKFANKKAREQRDLIVPLPRQAVAIIKAVAVHSRPRSEYVFASLRSDSRKLSENTITVSYRTMGIAAGVLNGHSWRAIARTRIVEDLGFQKDLPELQLGHTRPGLGSAYDRTELLPERRKMLQEWADYLDRLRDEARARAEK